MEPVRLSHRDRGPPPPSSTAAAASPLLPPPALRPPASGKEAGESGGTLGDGTGTEESEAGGADSSATTTAVLRRLDEDRLLAALLGAGNGSDLGRQKVGGGRASHGATVNRRSRHTRLLSTRLLVRHPALLDDLCPRLADRVLDSLDRWQFNAFLLDRLTSGRCLPTLCLHLLHSSGLLAHFRMDPTDVLTFFRLVERGYHHANPYHNALHACDVTQAMYVFCQQAAIRPHLTPLDLLAALVAAVGHDLDHPGVNEKFLVATGSHLAVLYDNVSVLENHHWRSAVSCFVEAGLGRYLTAAELAEFTDLVRSLILATDISRQQEFLAQFRYIMDSSAATAAASAASAGSPEAPAAMAVERDNNRKHSLWDLAATPHQRHFLLQIAIKCADISNPCRAWPVSRLWSLRACEEFFRQGDRERDELGHSAVTPICDRYNVTVAKVQVGFYTFVVEPLFREWHRFLASRLSAAMMASFAANQKRWEAEVLNEENLEDEEEAAAAVGCLSGESSLMTQATRTELEMAVSTEGGGARVPSVTGLSLSSSCCLDRRMSLPSSHHHREPLHRIFDQMLQPDTSVAAGMMTSSADLSGGSMMAARAGGSVNLKRNFSLTDRRRSSLLRGLYTRSSLKPTAAGGGGGRTGRLSRPTSACLETTTAASEVAIVSRSGCHHRTLQPMENRLEDAPAAGVAAAASVSTAGMDLTNFEEEGHHQQQEVKLLAVIKKNFLSPLPSPLLLNDDDNNDDDDDMMMMTAEREKENNSSGPYKNNNNLYHRLTQRRGSAPSNLVLGGGDSKVNSAAGAGSLLVRQQSGLALNTSGGGGSGNNRRGSLPSELLADSLPKQLRSRILGGASSSGKSSSSKGGGLLRRRSMGPEMLNLNHHNHHAGVKERPLVQKYLNRPF